MGSLRQDCRSGKGKQCGPMDERSAIDGLRERAAQRAREARARVAVRKASRALWTLRFKHAIVHAQEALEIDGRSAAAGRIAHAARVLLRVRMVLYLAVPLGLLAVVAASEGPPLKGPFPPGTVGGPPSVATQQVAISTSTVSPSLTPTPSATYASVATMEPTASAPPVTGAPSRTLVQTPVPTVTATATLTRRRTTPPVSPTATALAPPPSAIVPTWSPRPTDAPPIPTPTNTRPSPTPTLTHTRSPPTVTPTATRTRTPTPTRTATPTHTAAPTATSQPSATPTPVPPTPTSTVQPTAVPTPVTKVISAGGLDAHACDPTAWYFVITSIPDQKMAPGSINVRWVNGDQRSVPMLGFSDNVAVYATTNNLDSQVTLATATIYSGWSGEFNLIRGPCLGSAARMTGVRACLRTMREGRCLLIWLRAE